MTEPAGRITPPKRAAGILLHPSSLPGRYGIGDLGYELIAFLDWAATAGFRLWQVLPLNPPGFGNSPYGCLSSFAGNPLLISPQLLLQSGYLTAAAVANVPDFADDHAEFERVASWKRPLFAEAWKNFQRGDGARREPFLAFAHDPEQHRWLDDFALFMALKERNRGAPWWSWEMGAAQRDPQTLARLTRELRAEIAFHKFVQFLFFEQWAMVRAAAQERGIRIIGDVPIYVASDSADVWSHRELFQLDERGEPSVVAGVPPDYFSATGQRWGNPLYDWEAMLANGFAWWTARVRANLRFADIIRLDHFRGFAAYWEIPAHEETAIHGRWMPGPGKPLFDAIRADLGELPLIAEDLGFITPEVHELRHAIGVPGMKILQFGFGQKDSPHLPHHYEPATVVYTGTHDNDTARGWYEAATPDERTTAETYLGCDAVPIAWAMIRAAYVSTAQYAIVPLQDVLNLGSEGRMNRPGDARDNWDWRFESTALELDSAQRLRTMAEVSGRV